MFESKTLRLLQAENAAMRAQVSDMHERHLQIYREFALERLKLLDRILALSQPLALREVNRPTDTTAVPQKTKVESADMVDRNWPRPLVANRPSISPQEKDKQMKAQPLSDIEAAADFERKQG